MRPGSCGVAMASSDLDHLKISYRTRFCCTSRVPDTDLWQGQNILENIQDCFEEKSSDTGFSTNPGSPTLCSTPCRLRNDSYLLSKKECQMSPSKSDRISSVKKKANTPAFSQQSIILQNQANNSSGDLIGLKNTPNLIYASSGAEEFKKIPNEVVEEFYLTVGSPGLLAKETEILPLPQQATPSTTQDRQSCMFGNSVIQEPLLPKSSLKTKKSLNCQHIAAVWSPLKKVEKDAPVSGGQQKRKQSESSEQITQDPKQIQQKTKRSFSTLLLEAATRNCRNSSVLRHVSSPQIHSPSPLPNDLESSNDEFIIDELDCSVSQDWVLIPNKNSKSVKQNTTTPQENSQESERKKSRIEQQQGEKCNSASDKQGDTENGISDVISGEKSSKSIKHKVRAVEKSQSPKRKKLDNLSGVMGNASKSTKHRIYSEESEQFLENKRAVVQPQSEKYETQTDNRQSDEVLVNFAEENQDSFHSNQNVAEVDSALRITKSKTNSVEKLQTTERRKLRKHGMEQSKKKRFNLSQTNQDKLQRESDRSLEQQKESAESCHSAEKTLSASGKGKKNNDASQQIQKKGHLNKTTSKNQQISKKREIIPKQNKSKEFTVTRSQRISKRPSNWWVVTTEQSNMSYSPTLELPVNHKKKSKTSKETKKIPTKTLGKATIPLKQQKSSICAKPKEASIPNKQKRKKLSYSSDENCDMVHTVPKLDEQEGSLKETPRKKNVAYSSTAESPKECISDVQNVNLTPTVLTSDSKTSTMEESGPARLRNNVLISTNNKILGDEQECGTSGSVVNGTISNDSVSPRGKSNRKRENVNTDSCEDEQKKKAIAALNVSLGDPLKPTCVFDPGKEQMIFRDLVKLKGTHEFCVQDDTLKMFKILNTSLFATGTLILEPFKEKGKQYVCSDTVVFFVVSGDLICTLHETSYNLTTGDIFYVPSGNFYNIRNLLNERSILLFTQIKSERPEK
ncbi:centromere protein C isoform X2 [Dromiciops gliroides]|uniref:centromere protein C isoform X2 n=1 Tax=Dromiciops gliroides TaxID=33562 RepID=UPI001CC378E4|nr:centromere protein C isoform X2 [Dromiciops gliroides]